jgi:hypothetical protein
MRHHSAGAPFQGVDLGGGVLDLGEDGRVVLRFRNPTGRSIPFRPRLLIGPAGML